MMQSYRGTPARVGKSTGGRMPAKISKVNGGYEVRTPNSVHAKKTTKKKAEAQQRLLNAIDHNPHFRPTGLLSTRRG